MIQRAQDVDRQEAGGGAPGLERTVSPSIARREIASHRWRPVSFVFGPNYLTARMWRWSRNPFGSQSAPSDPARAQFHRCEPLPVNPESTRSRLRLPEDRGMMAVALETPS
jgi:hypothetical protein